MLIELDEYQRSNLIELFRALGYNYIVHPNITKPEPPEHNELSVLLTGDWVGEIYWKLHDSGRNIEVPPNVHWSEQRRKVFNKCLESIGIHGLI